MKKFYYPAIFALLLTSCSSAPIVSKESNASNKSAAANIEPVTNQSLNAMMDQANVNSVNAVNANVPHLRDTSVSLENMERLKSKGGGDQHAAPIPSVKATPYAAPDNSELSSTMNSKGVPIETRVFKSNPTLAKVERTLEDPANPVTKVYLKNGKVLIVPKDTIADSATATAAEFLRAVGVKP